MKKLLAASAIGLGALALTSGQAEAFVLIDNFDSGAILIEQPSPFGPVNGSVAANPGDIVGNSQRDYTYQSTGSSIFRAGFAVDGNPPGVPRLQIANPPNATSTVNLLYNDNAPYDLVTAEQEGQVAFNIFNNDLGATVELVINGVASSVTTTPGYTGAFTIPFTSFPGVDFNVVNTIALNISGPQDYDFVIDQFGSSVVPEPMTILGTAFALTALPGLKKAHSKKKAKA